VHEVGQRGVRRPLTDESGRQVEVVVVPEDGRLGLPFQLGQHRLGEAAVHGRVAVRPRVVEPVVCIRGLREPPEVVLREPEHRIGDDVVVEVVGLGVVGDEAQAVRRAVRGRLGNRLAGRILGDGVVLHAHRARDPRDVVVADETAQRGDKAAATPASETLAGVAKACVKAGLAVQAINRLASEDRRQAYEAYSLLSLCAKAGETRPILDTVECHRDIEVRLACIRLLGLADQPALGEQLQLIAGNGGVPERVRRAIIETVERAGQPPPAPVEVAVE
jgi:hypothetical protein